MGRGEKVAVSPTPDLSGFSERRAVAVIDEKGKVNSEW